MIDEVYGADVPDFAALGYRRDALGPGWWVDLASHRRTVDGAGLHGQIVGPRGAVSTIDFDAQQAFRRGRSTRTATPSAPTTTTGSAASGGSSTRRAPSTPAATTH